jgi:hypothetical protein
MTADVDVDNTRVSENAIERKIFDFSDWLIELIY